MIFNSQEMRLNSISIQWVFHLGKDEQIMCHTRYTFINCLYTYEAETSIYVPASFCIIDKEAISKMVQKEEASNT